MPLQSLEQPRFVGTYAPKPSAFTRVLHERDEHGKGMRAVAILVDHHVIIDDHAVLGPGGQFEVRRTEGLQCGLLVGVKRIWVANAACARRTGVG